MKAPRLTRLLLLAVMPRRLRDQIDGDLIEGFDLRVHRDGLAKARRWYWRQVFSTDLWRLRSVQRRRRISQGRRKTMVISEILQDLRYGIRTILREPLFAIAALATLAIGIGANAAIFTLVNSVLLRPLGYERPDELVMIFRTVSRFGYTRSSASYPDFADWRDQSTAFSDMGAYGYTTLNYANGETAEGWQGYRVTGNLFSVLGVAPLIGRAINKDDDTPGSGRVIVLSHSLWQNQFGADPNIAGQSIQVDGRGATVIGVMPASFDFPSRTTQFWTPLRGDRERLDRDTNFLTVIGRLNADWSLERAQIATASLAARIDESSANANQGYGIFLERRLDFVVRNARTALWIFTGAVAFVLMVALSNVANLMLARGATRTREIALRSALGASRGRLIRQLLAESTLLSIIGGVFGLGFALLILRLFITLGSAELPRLNEVQLDTSAFLFTAGLSLAAGILFGTMPALLTSRAEARGALRDASAPGSIRGGGGLQNGLVIAEIAIAVTLSIGAGLLLNSFSRLTSITPGFDPTNVVAARVAPPTPPMEEGQSEEFMMNARRGQQQFYRELLAGTSSLPGVTSAALSYGMPFGGYTFSRVFQPEGRTYQAGQEPLVNGNIVSSDFFVTLGISLSSGRTFSDVDTFESPSVAIVNETMASMFWPDQDPLGKRFRLGTGDGPWTTIIGTVPDVIRRSLDEDPAPAYYRPDTQVTWPDGMFVAIRSSTSLDATIAGLRREVRRLVPDLPITSIATATELMEESIAPQRFRTAVLVIFGAIAIGLSIVGIYGVISFTVGKRTREIGIRIALGAAQAGVLRMVLGRGLFLAGTGVVLGILGAVALTRFLANMLFQLTPYDPATYAASAILIIFTCLLATYGPARKAASTDPLASLKSD